MTEVRPATRDDLKTTAWLLRDAAQGLLEAGKQLWDPAQFTAAHLEPILAAGELVGVMYLQDLDPVFWGDQPTEESLFVHKLAVVGSRRGQGVSTALLQYGYQQCEAQRKRYLRLDCADRPSLRAVYERFGFQYRDSLERFGRVFCRLELPVQIDPII